MQNFLNFITIQMFKISSQIKYVIIMKGFPGARLVTSWVTNGVINIFFVLYLTTKKKRKSVADIKNLANEYIKTLQVAHDYTRTFQSKLQNGLNSVFFWLYTRDIIQCRSQ
jgi:hypothetical protein